MESEGELEWLVLRCVLRLSICLKLWGQNGQVNIKLGGALDWTECLTSTGTEPGASGDQASSFVMTKSKPGFSTLTSSHEQGSAQGSGTTHGSPSVIAGSCFTDSFRSFDSQKLAGSVFTSAQEQGSQDSRGVSQAPSPAVPP